MKKLKVFLLADSFQDGHHEQVRAAGMDPYWACVCREVAIPDDVEPPAALVQAARFADEAPVGHTMVVDPAAAARHGRRPVVGTLPGRLAGRPTRMRFLVGFTGPGDPREVTVG